MYRILIFLSLISFIRGDLECSAGFRSEPSDCGKYYQCNFGQRVSWNCPGGLHWSQRLSTCVWPKDSECQLGVKGQEFEVETKQSCTEGSYKSEPADCTAYYQCSNGAWLKRNCGGGTHWNWKINNCDWPNKEICPGDGSEDTTTTQGPTTTQGTTTARTTTEGTGPSTTSGPAPPPGAYKVICYYTDWSWYRPDQGKYMPSNIDHTLCTHIIYSFALLDSNDFTIKVADSWADIDNKFYEQVTAFKSKGTKVTIAIGGWNDSAGDKYSRMVGDPSARARFVKSVADFMQKYGFQGIDLDWEYPRCWQGDCAKGPPSDKANFAKLVVELRQGLPAGSLISAAVSAAKEKIDEGYDVPTLSKNLDWIGVMNYDYHGSWDGQTGHVAPMYSDSGADTLTVDYSIKYWVSKGADRSKLILGMPLYGQSFTLRDAGKRGLNSETSGPGTAGKWTRQGGFLAYYEICNDKSWNIVQDPKGHMGPYAYNGNQWVSYDDQAILVKKSKYIKSNSLGGAMVWAIDLDDFNNMCGGGKYPLLNTIYRTLQN